MGIYRGPNIVTDGLVLALDAGSTRSYPGTGTTWKDLSGNGNDGNIIGAPIFNNQTNSYFHFDGIDDKVQCGTSASLDITNHITIEMWFKTDNDVDIQRLLTKKTSNGTFGNGYEISRYSGDRMLLVYNNGDNRIFRYSNIMDVGFAFEFIHAVYVYRGNEQKWYLNGIDESGQQSFTTDFIAGSSINAELDLMTREIAEAYGDLSITRIYNRGLSDTEITQNYNAQKSRFGL